MMVMLLLVAVLLSLLLVLMLVLVLLVLLLLLLLLLLLWLPVLLWELLPALSPPLNAFVIKKPFDLRPRRQRLLSPRLLRGQLASSMREEQRLAAREA